MMTGDFDLREAMADLRSDEGVDPVMLVGPMPPWWIEALAAVFATPN